MNDVGDKDSARISDMLSTEITTGQRCRLELVTSIQTHAHTLQTNALQKKTRDKIKKYSEELYRGHYTKFIKLVQFFKRWKYLKIDAFVLQRYLRDIQDTRTSPNQEGMLSREYASRERTTATTWT